MLVKGNSFNLLLDRKDWHDAPAPYSAERLHAAVTGGSKETEGKGHFYF